ncbi:hypothetical protein [Trichormus variabilis]|uniref:hypothetical protein n=1 Tax=Anabaena variabilis TaxID=264691 RepID=UPI001687B528|nr:hypothetical protein [Trichormus variabilis]MBD2626245.1 hypothetical protein [Trichormus variabilis FACHB-164]
MVIGDWSLVIGHWSLVIGHWSLVIGHWSLGYSPSPRLRVPTSPHLHYFPSPLLPMLRPTVPLQ